MRLYVLTHTFPPSTHANAKRPFYVVQHALARGWEVEVLTSPLALPREGEETLQHPRLRIHRLDDPILRLQQRARSHPTLFRWLVLGCSAVMFPDACAWWVRRVLRQLRQGPPADRILAMVLPASMLLAGRLTPGVDRRWVFDFQEPVSPQQVRVRRRSPLQRAWRGRLEALERHTLHRAGRILFTARSNQEAYVRMGLAPWARTAHVPYFYDAALFEHASAPPVHPDFELVYFGTFDWRGARSPETFLRALAGFLQRHPEARPRTRFRIHGQWLPQHDRLLGALGLGDVFVRGRLLDYAGYVEEVRRSPVLLLVVSPAHDLYMPSKIVDYFGACRPILALVPPRSEMDQILRQAGFAETCCDPLDVDGVQRVLERLWQQFRSGTLSAPTGSCRPWSSETLLPIYWEHVEMAPEEVASSGPNGWPTPG
jgi:glycosyltransferase involved in cell wall biosynthesis